MILHTIATLCCSLKVLLLTALPVCLAQFSIQGPSDGNRRAQGLKFSEEKGIEYTDQSESEGAGDFTIQGATDGNSNFKIQGATDGHSDFQIQGPSDGGAAAFNIPGLVDGQSILGYDPNAKSLHYKDPSGYRVNWRSYERQSQPRPQVEQQYEAQAAVPARQHAQRRPRPLPQQQQPQQQQPREAAPVYKPYANAPAQIQQLLQYQQQIPYLNVIPEQFRFDEQAAIQAQAEQVREHYRNIKVSPPPGAASAPAPAPAPEPRQKRPRGHSRQKREASPQQQPRKVSQPQVEPQPHYSPNLPPQLQELLKFQAQTPYNIFANQVAYRLPDKPYVPQPVDAPQQQPQPQPQQRQAQYQGQAGAYQAQESAYTQARLAGYNQGQQLGYNQPSVRPVTENQY